MRRPARQRVHSFQAQTPSDEHQEPAYNQGVLLPRPGRRGRVGGRPGGCPRQWKQPRAPREQSRGACLADGTSGSRVERLVPRRKPGLELTDEGAGVALAQQPAVPVSHAADVCAGGWGVGERGEEGAFPPRQSHSASGVPTSPLGCTCGPRE